MVVKYDFGPKWVLESNLFSYEKKYLDDELKGWLKIF